MVTWKFGDDIFWELLVPEKDDRQSIIKRVSRLFIPPKELSKRSQPSGHDYAVPGIVIEVASYTVNTHAWNVQSLTLS